MDNLNRDHAKVCEKLKIEYEQTKEQFVSLCLIHDEQKK